MSTEGLLWIDLIVQDNRRHSLESLVTPEHAVLRKPIQVKHKSMRVVAPISREFEMTKLAPSIWRTLCTVFFRTIHHNSQEMSVNRYFKPRVGLISERFKILLFVFSMLSFACVLAVTLLSYISVTLWKPDVLCDESEYNFGVINDHESLLHEFEIKNIGSGALIIRKVQSDCSGCIEILKFTSTPILSGGVGHVSIKLKIDGVIGKINRRIIVQTNAPGAPALFLYVTANVVVRPTVLVHEVSSDLKPQVSDAISEKNSEVEQTVVVQPISSAPKPQVSDAISGENSEVEQIDTTKSVDSLDEK